MNRYTLTSSQLNAAEQQKSPTKDWQFYESTILKNRDNLGKILKEYKESGAWKEKYKSWAAACVPFSVSKRWANELIQTEQGGGPPTLANKTKKKEEACLTEIEEAREEKEEEPEAPAVHSADEVKQPEPKAHTNGQVKLKLPMDVTGCAVPQQNLGAVERADEVKAAMVCASTLKTLFEKVQNEADLLFSHVKHSGNTQTFMTGAASMYFALRDCLPEVVCPQCGGKSADCHYCFGTGWICKVKWDREWVKSNDRIKQGEVAKRAANLK